jgi:outer membrane lipoprotein-sorting protein
MMMTSWMGSHFTNDDLVSESSYEEDYDSSISFEGTREGDEIYEITSIPKPDAAVVWGKIVTIIDKPRLLPVSAIFYDEDGELVRTVTYSEPKRFEQRLVPSRMLLRPQDKPDEYTEVVYEKLSFDVKLPADIFSLQRLKSGR